ncbi:hypothetical protein BH23CHL2_BH23CHL2_08830 [soil metagenome]
MNTFSEIPVTQGSDRAWHVDTGNFSVRELYFDSGVTLPAHYHEHACLSLLASGTMKKGFGTRKYDLLSSSLITIPQGETHTDWFGKEGTRIVVIELDRNISQRQPVMEPGAKLLDEIVEQRSRKIEGFARRLSREVREPDDLSGLAVSGLVFELISSLGREDAVLRRSGFSQPAWLSKVIDFLHVHDDQHVRIEDIAAEVNLHPGYLARVFREQTGVPLGAYARQLRLERVAAELASTEDRILDIAIAAGFTDQSHLTRLFKRRYGVTPAQYRATMR